jgi:hypothetical protein
MLCHHLPISVLFALLEGGGGESTSCRVAVVVVVLNTVLSRNKIGRDKLEYLVT